MRDKETTIQRLKDLAEKFRQERDWGKHHSAKNLAASIVIEAAELLEKFQWGGYSDRLNHKEITGELADIVIYCLFFAAFNKIDISKAVEAKIKRIAKKYPVEVFNKRRDDPNDYWKIKKDYRKITSQKKDRR